MAMVDTYNTRKVDRVSLIVTAAVVVILSIQSLISGGIEDFLDTSIKGAVIVVLAVVIYFIPIGKYLKGFLFGLIPGIVMIALFYLTGFSIDKHYIIMASVAISALYFKKEILLAYGVVMNVAQISVYLLRPENLLGDGAKLVDFVAIVIMFNTSLVLLYLSNKWGRSLVEDAAEKESHSKTLLQKLEKTFNAIDDTTKSLDSDMESFNGNIQTTRDASSNVTAAMQEMTKVIQEEALSISSVNGIMAASLEKVRQAQEISNNVVAKSVDMIEKVEDGWDKINQTSCQIDKASDAMNNASTAVKVLQDSMGKIIGSLDGIKQIAEQTNMLALNAAIESARAGEHGRGFAVVSDEVRQLAEKSSKMVNDINLLVKDISAKTLDTFNIVTEGDTAARTSRDLLKEISVYFDQVRTAFKETNNEVRHELDMINGLSENYTESQKQIEAIASISEENAAAVEEILATVEDENQQIIQISGAVEGIRQMSRDLKDMLNAG